MAQLTDTTLVRDATGRPKVLHAGATPTPDEAAQITNAALLSDAPDTPDTPDTKTVEAKPSAKTKKKK